MEQVTMREILAVLRRAVSSPGKWWPAETRFEILVGAVLTQNTTWTSVEKAIAKLRQGGLLQPEPLSAAAPETIGAAIRSAGYWRTKTAYLLAVTEWFVKNDARAAGLTDAELRQSLLEVRGVGEETADDIVLYAYKRPVFIYDAYGRRLLKAAGWGEFSTYRAARRGLDERIRAENLTVSQLAELHGLIVQAGKEARAAGGWDEYWSAITA